MHASFQNDAYVGKCDIRQIRSSLLCLPSTPNIIHFGESIFPSEYCGPRLDVRILSLVLVGQHVNNSVKVNYTRVCMRAYLHVCVCVSRQYVLFLFTFVSTSPENIQ